MYAIVDIETTGGNSKKHRITEIAVCIHNGEKVLSTFETLVNPEVDIPFFITSLTGITNEMVSSAPTFEEIAEELYELLNPYIFVAHNVGFDYGFIKNHFADVDIQYQSKRLCSARLSRKVFPGLGSYGLGNLAKAFKIKNEARHRAMGDAMATAKLFSLLVKHDKEQHLEAQLKRSSGETRLPPNFNKDCLKQLPESQGLYYFENKLGEVIYVGRSINIKKRVLEHFTLNSTTQRRTYFIDEIHKVFHKCYEDELITSLMECHEIKRLWPKYNSEFKKRSQAYGVYSYKDQNGHVRFYVNKLLHKSKPEVVFQDYTSAFNFVKEQVLNGGLCPKKSGLQESDSPCMNPSCQNGACAEKANENYRQTSEQILNEIRNSQPSLAIYGNGPDGQKSVVLIEKGHYRGWGYSNTTNEPASVNDITPIISPYKENIEVHKIIHSYLEKSSHENIVILE